MSRDTHTYRRVAMHTLEKSERITLLASVVDEEHKFREAHQGRVNFYSSLIATLIAATIAGVLSAKESSHYLFLLTGPFLVWAVAQIAETGTFRLYQRFLEAITVRAKLEQSLGLTLPLTSLPLDSYWPGEPLIPDRQLQSRRHAASSGALIAASCGQGYNRATQILFLVLRVIALVLAGGLSLMAIMRVT